MIQLNWNKVTAGDGMDCKFVFETCSEFDTMSLVQNQHEAQISHIIELRTSAETKLTSRWPLQGDVTL